MAEEERLDPIIVPAASLAPATLTALIQEFLIREAGQDHIASLEDSDLERVRRALSRSEVLIAFEPREESVGLIRRDDVAPELRP